MQQRRTALNHDAILGANDLFLLNPWQTSVDAWATNAGNAHLENSPNRPALLTTCEIPSQGYRRKACKRGSGFTRDRVTFKRLPRAHDFDLRRSAAVFRPSGAYHLFLEG